MPRKNFHAWISVFAVLLFGFLFSQDALAKVVWQKYRSASIATTLTKNAKLALEIGNYYFNGRGGYNLEKAESGFRRAIAIDDKILWGHYQLARVYFVKGNLKNALEEINKELVANPANLRSLYVRGLIYGSSEKLAEAEADFRRFTFWAPTEWGGYNDLAWILAKEGKYADAEKAAAEGIKEATGGDQNAWLWNSLGVAQLNLEKYDEAEKSFRKALELARNMTEDEWARAYPGNNPKGSSGGLRSFKAAVEANLSKAVDKASL